MSENRVSSAAVGNLANTETLTSIDAVSTDGAGDQKETTWQNFDWSKQYGAYLTIPEYRIAIDAKATWTIGKGFQTDEQTETKIMTLRGNGKESFNSIIKNQATVKEIGGDSYAEIIKSTKLWNRIKRVFGADNELVNLKPLDPAGIVTVQNRQGIIIRYEQINKVKGSKKTFKPEQIFHLSRNRVADEMHGQSIYTSVEWIIKARKEAMEDMRKLMHRHVKPIIAFKLDTDDDTKIDAFIKKADAATEKGENLYYPMNTVEHEIIQTSASGLNPLPWINTLNAYFYQSVGVPQVVIGGAQEIVEASAKISYLSFEQVIKAEQLYLEEQILEQLGLEVNFEFPASLENEMLSDRSKEESMQAATPEDVGMGQVAPTEAGAQSGN